tara:strand:+ start:133 stop:252 length:120 start_codon:yes stop_codon:yes gene_type:complete
VATAAAEEAETAAAAEEAETAAAKAEPAGLVERLDIGFA